MGMEQLGKGKLSYESILGDSNTRLLSKLQKKQLCYLWMDS
jgi:hypothetical protein